MNELTNTQQISLCPNCSCMTFTLMDDDGNRYCGKCKELKNNKSAPMGEYDNDRRNYV